MPPPPPKPSLTGVWVTSFISFYPVGKADALLPLRLMNRFVGWIPDAAWDSAFATWENDPSTDIVDRQLLEVLLPAPLATLTCFVFKDDGTFTADVNKNAQNYFEHSDWTGTYTIGVTPSGVPGGDIVFLNQDQTVHTTMKYFMISRDELKFITAYGAKPDADTLDLPQNGAGTMQRVRV